MSCYILTIDIIGKINGDGMIQNANISEYTHIERVNDG